MGYFERHLSAMGEAVDEGIDRAKDRTRELCDRSGWGDKAEQVRDQARERREAAQRTVGSWWLALGEDHRRHLFLGLLVLGVFVAVMVGRSLLIHKPAGPSQSELELVERARRQSATGDRLTAPTGPSNTTPWGAP